MCLPTNFKWRQRVNRNTNLSIRILLKPQEKKEKSLNNLMIYCKVCGQNEKYQTAHNFRRQKGNSIWNRTIFCVVRTSCSSSRSKAVPCFVLLYQPMLAAWTGAVAGFKFSKLFQFVFLTSCCVLIVLQTLHSVNGSYILTLLEFRVSWSF